MSVISHSAGDLALLGGIPLADVRTFPLDRTPVSREARNAVLAALDSGCWSMFSSREVESFEEEFAEYVGAKHVILVNSCTTGIYAALLASGIGPGAFVGVPAYTYVGTCSPVVSLGATPVFVDIDSISQTMDPRALEDEVRNLPLKAVVQAHLFGMAHHHESIARLCTDHAVMYISDCAQLLGVEKVTSRLCELGMCCFSFGESKVLRTGEGGAVATNSEELAERLRLARHEGEIWLGQGRSRIVGWAPTPRDVLSGLVSIVPGLNFRPAAVLAALGRAKLRELPAVLDRIARNAECLYCQLLDLDGLELPPKENRVWWTFPLTINHPFLDRDTVLAALLAEGVPAGVHFPTLMSRHPLLARAGANSDKVFKQAESFSRNHLVLPIYPALEVNHLQVIAAAMRKVLSCSVVDLPALKDAARTFLDTSHIAELCSGLFMYLG